MSKINSEFPSIQATKSVVINYDLADGWFAIVDSEECDRLGAVSLALDEIDVLIVALGALRERAMVMRGISDSGTTRRKDERP